MSLAPVEAVEASVETVDASVDPAEQLENNNIPEKFSLSLSGM